MSPFCSVAVFCPGHEFDDCTIDDIGCEVNRCGAKARVYVHDDGTDALEAIAEDVGAWLCPKHLAEYVEKGMLFGADARKWAADC